MDDDEEDFFSGDDGFDDIPDTTLQALETEALHSTQAAAPQKHSSTTSSIAPTAAPPTHHAAAARSAQPLRKQAHNAASLNRAGGGGGAALNNNNNLPWRPPTQQQQQRLIPSAPPASAPKPPSSDYGFDDEDVIDLDEPSMVIQPASRPPPPPRPVGQNYQQRPNSRYGARQQMDMDPETAAAFAAADQELGSQSFVHVPPQQQHPQQRLPQQQSHPEQAAASIDMSVLQARIAELEAEHARLRQSEQQAREEARAKQGEIAIVRSNQEKVTKQYEARISVMQRLHADEAAKAKAEIEAQRKEREKMQTDNRFLQHDLAQEAERAKRLTGPSRTKSTQRETPRKSKRTTAHGDGFNDSEVRLASPSRSREKTRGEGTPRLGAKRKRAAHDSPVAALSFTQPPQPLRQESTEQSALSLDSSAPDRVAVVEDKRYEFMQLVLNHCPYEGHEATVESLAKYSFPSKPAKTLSSIFIHAISYPTAPDDNSLPLRVSRTMLHLWLRCLQEKYFAPFYLILDMLRFALQTELSSTKSLLLEEAIPLCSQSIDLIAVPTVRASKNRSFAASMDQPALDELAEKLDIERILEFMEDLCNAALLNTDRIETFWRSMELTFTLLMLNKAQPVSQILAMLRMLATSARDTTFGCISADPHKQVETERAMIDRLTNLLFEMPEPPKDEPPYDEAEVMELRLEVLRVFRCITRSDHGGLLLSQQRNVIGRMVRFLDSQVNKLYAARPTIGLEAAHGGGHNPQAHDLIAQTVNLTVRILYHLLRTYDDTLDIVPKLHAVHGGYHKFLISLTRVAFSEQLVFEAGIEDEVAEAAHNILDNVLGPEDGEAVMKAVETPRGTRGSTFERATTSGEDGEQIDDTTMDELG